MTLRGTRRQHPCLRALTDQLTAVAQLLKVTSPVIMQRGRIGQTCSQFTLPDATDSGVHAVSPQVTLSHPSGGRLPLLSAKPAVTFPVEKRHRPSAGSK